MEKVWNATGQSVIVERQIFSLAANGIAQLGTSDPAGHYVDDIRFATRIYLDETSYENLRFRAPYVTPCQPFNSCGGWRAGANGVEANFGRGAEKMGGSRWVRCFTAINLP